MASRSMRRKKTSERLGRPRRGSAASAVVAHDPHRPRGGHAQGRRRPIRARVTIGADGLRSLVARRLGRRADL